jgi:hypothetical protein
LYTLAIMLLKCNTSYLPICFGVGSKVEIGGSHAQKGREEFRVRLKLVVLALADHLGVIKACREFEVPRSNYYRCKEKYEKDPSPIIIPTKHPRYDRLHLSLAGKTPYEVMKSLLQFRAGGKARGWRSCALLRR